MAFTKQAIAHWAEEWPSPGSVVQSDGLACYREAGIRMCRPSSTTAVWPRHLPRNLAEFEYRFNQHFRLRQMTPKLLKAEANTAPIPYRSLSLAEVHA